VEKPALSMINVRWQYIPHEWPSDQASFWMSGTAGSMDCKDAVCVWSQSNTAHCNCIDESEVIQDTVTDAVF